MRRLIKNTLNQLVKNDVVWSILRPLSSFGAFTHKSRSAYTAKAAKKQLELAHIDRLEVHHGPFKGIKYPEPTAVASSLYPKILGSYEKELWEIVNEFKTRSYTDILDIGCAEGYYAVGFGVSNLDATIYAYDTNEEARELCRRMAQLNNISNRVVIKPACTAEELAAFPFKGKSLVISDCEGFEKVLFNELNVKNLVNCDLIIETHDFIDVSISSYIKGLFKDTHHITLIKSIDDIEKAHTYHFSELTGLDLSEKKRLLGEERPAIMEWVICEAKLQAV